MIMRCSECNRDFSEDDLITFGNAMVCAECKPVFVQKLREGITRAGEMVYGGFWIRAGAKILDGIILSVANGLVGFAASFMIGPTVSRSGYEFVILIIVWTLSFALNIGYVTYFLGKFGATPGKMACGLKVVRPDGEKISYARACGRFFADILSAMILYIGYIMVAFDEEKRALHDHICDTRVIKA
jgi:uncharacterized RDD family membrane protein YckC